ncbi:MAG: hypothetical protein WBB70_17690 [Desulfobacterales bacterium]|jgi:hypothetical protein
MLLKLNTVTVPESDALVAGWNLALEHILTKFETNLKDLDLKEGKTS